MTSLPPALIPLAAAVVLPLLPKPARGWFFLLPPALCLVLLPQLATDGGPRWEFLAYHLQPLVADRLSLLFAAIFSIIVLAGGIYALHVRDAGQQAGALLYFAGSLGVVFAGDLLTLYAFWELMAISSVVLIWSRRDEASARAGGRYILVHLAGGITLLAGILLHLQSTGSLEFRHTAPGEGGAASWLILAGFALNAAVVPLHAWLPDAYPRGTITGSVFLSALTTKTAVYVLIRGFAGWEILLWAGCVMAVYGVLYAILANDIRRILAYHIVSQVGYMVAGTGIGTALAVNGAAAHAFCHILYKALLFMGTGAVLHQTGRSRLTDLGGLARLMPAALLLYMVGAVSISGVPLFNGFVSKNMVIAAAEESHITAAFLLLELASVGTFLSVGLKLPWFTWFGKPSGVEPARLPFNMVLGMGLTAAACVLLGVAPGILYRFLPHPVHYEPFASRHVIAALQLLGFTGIGFFLLMPRLSPHRALLRDVDWLYRAPAHAARAIFVNVFTAVFHVVEELALAVAGALTRWNRNPVAGVGRLWGRPADRARAYDPDRQRPPIQVALTLTLLFAVLLGIWASLR